MSRRVRFYGIGGPEVLQIEGFEAPTSGHGEVRIAVKALGINRSEAMFRGGTYTPPVLPSRVGYEAAGVIDEIGPGVSGLQIGDIVSVIPVAGGIGSYGTYGDGATVPAYNVVKHPRCLSFVEAAAVWMDYIAAYGMLVDVANVTRDELVLINAASSGVGIAAIQIANLLGAIPVAATRSRTKRKALLQAGAAHVIATQEGDVSDSFARFGRGREIRAVFDPVAGPSFRLLVEAVSPGGILVLFGLLDTDQIAFSARTFLSNALTLATFRIGDLTVVQERLERAKRFIIDGLQSGNLRPAIDRVFTFAEIVDAHRYLESNEHVGKIVVTV